MFKKILIANRGEIACRIMRTAQRMGIHCVAIYSEIDHNAGHVREADSAYCVGPAPSRNSYLNLSKIIDVAKQTGVEAIHPGYGFLSENPEFALQCEKNAITFIGPSVEAIRVMGDKSAAKNLMQQAKVPIIPGYHGVTQEVTSFEEAARSIGYPILIKAAAGGGGKGMRIVENASQLKTALESAKREAASSFGDDRLLLEKYFKNSRHIEIQILADNHGNCIYLGERDCSIQRRHQKIIEEAPAFGLTKALRQKMGIVAVDAAKAINYQNAGTIEFLLAENNQFYFMEMNTRLQVEHPVTEMITGLDLVEHQLKIACGEVLEFKQSEIKSEGHAIEVRIYAEDPLNNFLPSTGKITYLKTPEYCRIDSGVELNDQITSFYDPMIAKLIIHEATRAQAITALENALADWQMGAIKSNVAYLHAITKLNAYSQGQLNTQFIDIHHEQILELLLNDIELFIVIASIYYLEKQLHAHPISNDIYSPWSVKDAWQLNQEAHQQLHFISGKQTYSAFITFKKSGFMITVSDQAYEVDEIILENNQLQFRLSKQSITATILEDQEQLLIFYRGNNHTIKLSHLWQSYEDDEQTATHLSAPMPGIVVAIMAKNGQRVARGDRLLIMEAMKMEHTIVAPATGVIKSINYGKGDQVEEGAQLLSFEAISDEFTPQSKVN